MDVEKLVARTLRNGSVALVLSGLFLFLGQPAAIVGGFMAGIAVGMWNAYFLVQRFNRATGQPVKKGKGIMYGGIMMRLTLIFGLLLLAFRLPQYLNLLSSAAGLMVIPFITLTISLGNHLRERLTNRTPV